ncbi:hypothetical protein KOR42_23880 [Thalassoglobus neptunius]|uniref:DUF4143 domain-containing protein n=1 Tax=Thalassoglobus neptunius TaxID=1938619 RepID=A0A5C5X9D8_9PLAN|nr:hypothetical protein [Thalassoglobus neptunius]TWT59001.1 hypothetical protein KOR42_23880 [Thalassoglobus neptunius]
MTVQELVAALSGWQLPIVREEFVLQQNLEQVLIQEIGSEHFQREYSLSDRERIDFMCFGSIGIEVKTQGSMSSVAAQLLRYAECEEVKGLILVTTRRRHLFPKSELAGKPFGSILLGL